MTSRIKQHKFIFLAIVTMLVLICTTFVMLRNGWIGTRPLKPDVVLLVNDKVINTFQQPVFIEVEPGHQVYIEVKIFHDGQPLNSDLTYYWCFDPPINNNNLCSLGGINPANIDYRPDDFSTQNLTVTVKHPDFAPTNILLKFEPSQSSATNQSGDN